jgi:hypothetical protein
LLTAAQVGWMFTDLTALDKTKGTVRCTRDLECVA